MRVLICDDEPSIRLLFRTAFERYGSEVDEAEDGAGILDLASRTQPDVIILDMFMPGADGLTVLPILREASPDSSVYMVSAHANREAFDQSIARGATACFDKLDFLPRIPELIGL